MLSALLFIIFMIASYLIGSLCSAILVSRLFSLPDPRVEGSKNPGATNVLRLSGKKYALIVLLVDMFKGFLPVFLLKMLGYSPNILGLACFAAVIGHMYPFFFNFQGGKGVATALGGILGLSFMLGVTTIATWLLIANFTRYASLASVGSLLLAPLYVLFIKNGVLAFIPLLSIAAFVVYKHRDNITRLIDGEEHKIQFKRNSLVGEVEATLVDQEKEDQYDEKPQEKSNPPETKAFKRSQEKPLKPKTKSSKTTEKKSKIIKPQSEL